jgi:hypothetical protein
MTVIEEHPGNSLQVFSQFDKLALRLRDDKNTPTLPHGITKIAAVLGYAAK